jgi:hypothetical protein
LFCKSLTLREDGEYITQHERKIIEEEREKYLEFIKRSYKEKLG